MCFNSTTPNNKAENEFLLHVGSIFTSLNSPTVPELDAEIKQLESEITANRERSKLLVHEHFNTALKLHSILSKDENIVDSVIQEIEEELTSSIDADRRKALSEELDFFKRKRSTIVSRKEEVANELTASVKKFPWLARI